MSQVRIGIVRAVGTIDAGGRFPITTDGGTMSFNHSRSPQMLQRVARGVEQLRGSCPTRQVAGARVAIATACARVRQPSFSSTSWTMFLTVRSE